MTYDDNVIVLNTTRVKENSIVLHTISRTCGRKSFLVRIGRNTGMSYFLPLNILEISVTENPKSDLWYAKVISAEEPLNSIRDNICKNTISLFMAEVLFRIVKSGNAEDGLYEWCRRQILTLEALETDFSNFHIRFLLELAVALGFSPQTSDIIPFSGEHQSEIELFMTSSLAESMLIPLTGPVRNDLASSLIRYLEFHTESAINIRSLAVLRQLFS